MAIAPRASISGSGETTTSITLVIPATVEEGDWMEAWFTNGGGTADPDVSDDGDAGEWSLVRAQLFATSSREGTVWGKYATADSAGATITATGFTTSCAGGMDAFSGVDQTTAVEAIVSEANANNNETMVETTSTNDGGWLRLFVMKQGVVDTTTAAATDPSSLDQLSEHLSGGCSGSSFGAVKASAGATGAITWAGINTTAASIAYFLVPAADAGGTVGDGLIRGILLKRPSLA